jgi:hypothetical protein
MEASMPRNAAISENAVTGLGIHRFGLAIFLVFIVPVLCLLALSILYGSNYAAVEAAQIERENAAFCSKVGLAPGSAEFATCGKDLMQIRTNHLDRFTQAGLI